MSNVVGLHGKVAETDPVPDVVEDLERLLADARSGNIRAIAYAVARRNEVSATGWVGDYGTFFHLHSVTALLLHRMTNNKLFDD